MYVTISVGNERQLRTLFCRRVHIAAQWRKREASQVSKKSSAVCS